MYGIGDWFCCLSSPEQFMLVYTATNLLPPINAPVPYAAWDAVYSEFDGCGQARRDAFLFLYELDIVPIEIDPELPPVDCVVPTDTALWTEWWAFVLLGGSACPDGCTESKLPWATTPP